MLRSPQLTAALEAELCLASAGDMVAAMGELYNEL